MKRDCLFTRHNCNAPRIGLADKKPNTLGVTENLVPSRPAPFFDVIRANFLRFAPFAGLLIILLFSPSLQKLAAQNTADQKPGANEILAKVQASYSEIKDYRLVAVREFEENVEASRISASDARRSSKIEIDISALGVSKGSIHMRNGKHEIQSFTDGQTVWAYQPERKKYSASPRTVAGTVANAKNGDDSREDADVLRVFERVLVDRYRSIARLSERFVRQKDRVLDLGDGTKVDCYVFKMALPQEWHEIWIDQDRYIVRRSVDYTEETVDGSDKRKTTLTLTVKSLETDPKFDETAFTFAPPAGSKRVDSVQLRWDGKFSGLEAPAAP